MELAFRHGLASGNKSQSCFKGTDPRILGPKTLRVLQGHITVFEHIQMLFVKLEFVKGWSSFRHSELLQCSSACIIH